MGFINSMFTTEETVSAAFYQKSTTMSNGRRTESYALLMTVDGLFWEGRAIDQVVSERIRADVDAVLVIDYEDYSSDVSDIDKVTIDSVDYSVVHADNIARQNVSIEIPLKRYS